MSTISLLRLNPDDLKSIELIADWYLDEWKIPVEKTISRLSQFPTEGLPFQMLLTVDNSLVATAGLYHHVGMLDREPRFKVYGPWLALVYTSKENRNQGYGESLCREIQQISKGMGLKEIFLFTDTAEKLYSRLGWEPLERIQVDQRNIVVMRKDL